LVGRKIAFLDSMLLETWLGETAKGGLEGFDGAGCECYCKGYVKEWNDGVGGEGAR
jgi:hypothetical protein